VSAPVRDLGCLLLIGLLLLSYVGAAIVLATAAHLLFW
jgi:hypothetical protein